MTRTEPPPACWICGGVADSAEHKIKKSDLRRLYGPGPYRGDGGVTHFKEGRGRPIQGPDADRIKHMKSLCVRCNGARTQPFDRSYDRFLSWMMTHQEEVLRERKLDMASILGRQWRSSQWNLLRYFAKGLGCQLRDADVEVPGEIVQLVRGGTSVQRFRLSFAVSEGFLRLKGDVRWAGISGLIVHRQRTTGVVTGFHSARQYQWLFIWVLLNHWPDEATGPGWACDERVIGLGSVV